MVIDFKKVLQLFDLKRILNIYIIIKVESINDVNS